MRIFGCDSSSRGPVHHSSWGIGIDVPASVHVCRGSRVCTHYFSTRCKWRDSLIFSSIYDNDVTVLYKVLHYVKDLDWQLLLLEPIMVIVPRPKEDRELALDDLAETGDLEISLTEP